MQKLSKTLAILALMTPLSASALGTGEMKLYSSLNQRLNAEVPLVVGSDESLEGLQVNLASAAAFARIGVERPYFLTGLRFEVLTKGKAVPTIKITSSEPITEPFARFLVEMRWPQGHVVRDFTLLLDPPPTATSKVLATHGTSQRSAPQPESFALAGAHANAANFNGSVYGPVGMGDTLWSIAKVVNRDAGVSVEQMVAALYEANPQAFENANVGAIVRGTTLRVPDKAAVLRRNVLEAKKFIEEHSGSKHAGDAEKLVAAVAPPAAVPSKKVKATPPAPQIPAANKALTLLTPDQASSAKNSKSGGMTSKDELALEIAYTVKQENEEIRSRLVGLENQLNLMQRLLTLKDEQIAALQAGKPMPILPPDLIGVASKPAAAPATPSPTPQPVVATNPPAPPAVVPPPPVTDTAKPATPTPSTPPAAAEIAKPAETAAAPAIVVPPVVVDATKPAEAAAPVVPVPSAAPPTVTTTPSEAVTPPAPQPPVVAANPEQLAVVQPPTPAPQPKPLPQPTPPPVEEPGWYADTSLLGMLGAVVLLIAGLAVLAIKRRRAALAEFDADLSLNEVRPVNLAQATEHRSKEADAVAGLNAPSKQGSFLSDFTPSDFDVLDGDNQAVDPISEADVYLAYGRFSQAEELIRKAINENPFRDECKLKLLEVFYSAQNSEAFEKYASELLEENKNTDRDFWARVVDMGSSLLPENPMFSRGGEPAKAPVATVAPAQPEAPIVDDMDFSFDLELDELAPVINEPVAKQQPNDLDFAVVVEAEPAPEPEISTDIGLSFSGVDDSSANTASATPPEAQNITADDMDFSFDFEIEEPASAASEPVINAPIAEPPSDIQGFDTPEDLSFSGIASVTASSSAVASDELSAGLEMDFSSLGLEQPEANLTEFAAEPLDTDITPATPPAEEDDLGLSFDMAGFNVEPSEPEITTATVGADDESALEFDVSSLADGEFSFAGVVQSVNEPEPPVVEDHGRTMEFDITPPASPSTSSNSTDDEFNFEMSFDLSSQPLDEPVELDEVELLPEEINTDEIESKLDLARAFIDMENPAAAQQMLEEVIKHGDARQKEEAQELLNTLG